MGSGAVIDGIEEYQGPLPVRVDNDENFHDENDDNDEIRSLRDRSSFHHSFLRFGLL